MIDPCWLPSAIIQSVVALYAIYIAIFILTLQHLKKHDMLDYEIKKLSGFIDLWPSKKPSIIEHFMYSSFIVALTIVCNGYFIYIFTIYEPVTGESIRGLLALSLLSLLTVGYVVYLSYTLIETLIKKDEQTNS